MDEVISQGVSILRGMWRRRWIGLLVAWVVAIAAVIMIVRTPDKYEASARIFVDTQSVLTPLMSGLAIPANVDQQISMLSRTLISRPNVEKLIRMADLDLGLKSKEDQEQMIDSLIRTLQISGAGRDNLYTLAFRDPDPERAKRVVQSFLSIFVESSLGGKRKDTDSAKKFIDEQVKVYQKKLEEAENRVKQFRLRNLELSTADGKDYYSRIGDVSSALSQARLGLREAENSRDALKRQVAGEEPVLLPEPPEQANATAVPEIDGRVEALKRNLDSLRQRFTDEHPDVVGAKRIIEGLEEQRRAELAARKKPVSSRPVASINSNPVYQQLKVSLGEAEATVASLTTRVAEYESRYARLREAAKLVPEVEIEFAQLNRDYEVHKRNYDGLVTRRESAEISGEMEASTGVADFRLIDPPRVSPQPVAPNRALLFPMALLGALAAGIVASFLVSRIWPTFFDLRSLRAVTGLPMLGSVSLILSESQRRKERRGLAGFLTAFVAFLGTFGAGLVALALLSTRAV
ncbi:MAG: XrtA system polysaccharide chain length determinant [Casimicrobiaceae bacterium]